MTEQQQPADG